MGLILNKNIFGPRVKYSSDVKEINDNEILIPDWIEAEINGTFTDNEGITQGDKTYGYKDKGVRIDNKPINYDAQILIDRSDKIFRNVTYRSDETGGEKLMANIVFKRTDIKYLYDNSNLPLTDDNRLFVKIGNLEYRISSVDRKSVTTHANTTYYEYQPVLTLCHNGKALGYGNYIFGKNSYTYTGGSYNGLGLLGSDLTMTILKITNFNPTVTLNNKNTSSGYYETNLNGYVNINGEQSQQPNGYIYIPIFYPTNTYGETTYNTQFFMVITGKGLYSMESDIRLHTIQLIVNKLRHETTTIFPFTETKYSGIDKITTTMSSYTPDIESYITKPLEVTPTIGAHIGWTFNPVEDLTTDNIVYNTLEVTEYEPDPEPEPEVVEPADNPETEYTPPLQEAFEEFPYRGSDTITGLEPGYNSFRPSYSNYIFPKYYRDSIAGDSDWESAITFIQEACNPSAFELWGAAFKLITGHPTPGEIISRVYYLPFEYSEIRGTDSAGYYFSAPVYGPIGPVTLGTKTHSEDPSNTGEPIKSNVHYYQQIANRFKTINLGQVTIDRVFNNFLDYSDVEYTLNLPYGAGQVELDPDLLFKNDISVGNVKLTGVIDFDTGELTIIIQLNGQRYYETTVNIAIDRLASVADNMAAPLAIAKASMAAGAAAGGITKFIGGGHSFNSNQTYDERNAQEVNRVQQLALEAAGDHIADLRTQIANLRKGGK